MMKRLRFIKDVNISNIQYICEHWAAGYKWFGKIFSIEYFDIQCITDTNVKYWIFNIKYLA